MIPEKIQKLLMFMHQYLGSIERNTQNDKGFYPFPEGHPDIL